MYMITRGAYDRVQRWINDIYSQRLPYKCEDGTKKYVRIVLRPLQLFEVVFPEDQYKEVLATVQPYGTPWAPLPVVFALRKMLNLKPIKELVKPNFKVDHDFVHCTGIGVRKDEYHPDGWEMI